MNQKLKLQNLSSSIDSETTSLKRSFNLGAGDYFIEAFQALQRRLTALEAASTEYNDRQLFDKVVGLRQSLSSVGIYYEAQDENNIQASIAELETRSLDLKNFISIQEDNFEQQFSEINKY
jgi:hypothetical protein